MLVHASFGSVRKLSIPRDVEVEVPGHGINKINAAYAFGGPALTIETVESFLGNGLQVNHVVEVDFKNFPDFIDSLGGVTVNNKTRICSPPFDNFWKGLHFRKGEIDLNGERALGYARVRKNSCAPAEDDRDRAARQQQVLSAIGSQVKSPSTFFRLPWVSWNAPRTLRSDMNGFQLMGLFADMATGSSDNTEVLEATCCRGSNLFVSDGAKADAVRKLEEGARPGAERLVGAGRALAGARVRLLLRVGRARGVSPTSTSPTSIEPSDDEPSEEEPSDAPAAPDFFLP